MPAGSRKLISVRASRSPPTVLRRARRDDAPGRDDRDAVGEGLRLVHVVRGEEDRLAQVAQAADHVPGLAARRGVEAGGRLVEEEQLGVADQGEGDVEPPLLPARERRGPGVRLLGEADQLHRLVDVARGGVVAGVLLDGLPRRELRDQPGLLEDEADAVAPGAIRLLRIDAEHAHLAGVAGAVALEDLDRGRLARAVRSDEGEDLAGADLEIDPPHRLEAVVGLAQALDADHRLAHGTDVMDAPIDDTQARGTRPLARCRLRLELHVAVDDLQLDVVPLAQSRAIRSATVTERWRPPVQPTAIVRCCLPSAT